MKSDARPSNLRRAHGLSESHHESNSTTKEQARTTGVRGETFAYWYLRRQGYTLVARNSPFPESKVKSISSATTAAHSRS